MVAKSFQNLKIEGKPFTQNGRKYVNVVTSSGSLRKVRWYSDFEYRKMYPDERSKNINDPYYKSQKIVLGFINDFITIFKNNTYENSDYFRDKGARYTKWWGWFFPSDVEVPEDLPEGVTPVRLDWSLVGADDEKLRSDKEVADIVDSLIYENGESEYQGEIGEKLDRILIVEKAIALDGYYGASTMHIMRDDDGNCYVWTTAAKSWEPDTEHHIVGTVKDHKQYKGIKQTILTRCREK